MRMQFFKLLVEPDFISVKEAFDLSKDLFKQDKNWIEPVLLPEDEDAPHESLYDSMATEGKKYIPDGNYMDTSKVKGQLIGMKKNVNFPIGQEVAMHQALTILTNYRDPVPLLYVTGKEQVGKKTYMKEVCTYLHNHFKFRTLILYENLEKITKEKHFS